MQYIQLLGITAKSALQTARLCYRKGRHDSWRIYAALTSPQAQATYRLIWLLMQLAFWSMVIAGEFCVKKGREFRHWYEERQTGQKLLPEVQPKAIALLPPAPSPKPEVSYDSFSIRELKQIAKDRRVSNYSRMRKAQLIEALAA